MSRILCRPLSTALFALSLLLGLTVASYAQFQGNAKLLAQCPTWDEPVTDLSQIKIQLSKSLTGRNLLDQLSLLESEPKSEHRIEVILKPDPGHSSGCTSEVVAYFNYDNPDQRTFPKIVFCSQVSPIGLALTFGHEIKHAVDHLCDLQMKTLRSEMNQVLSRRNSSDKLQWKALFTYFERIVSESHAYQSAWQISLELRASDPCFKDFEFWQSGSLFASNAWNLNPEKQASDRSKIGRAVARNDLKLLKKLGSFFFELKAKEPTLYRSLTSLIKEDHWKDYLSTYPTQRN